MVLHFLNRQNLTQDFVHNLDVGDVVLAVIGKILFDDQENFAVDILRLLIVLYCEIVDKNEEV